MSGGQEAPAPFHPDLRLPPLLPVRPFTPRTLGLARALTGIGARIQRSKAVVERLGPDASVHVHRPPLRAGSTGALLWVHGGGLLLGHPRQDDAFCSRVAAEAGVVVAAVEHRLAPEHVYPAALEDCWTALQWLAAQPGIDATRIVVGGSSAGGGLAAALCLLARERGGVRPALQLLVYPMLDDRTCLRQDIDTRPLRMWDLRSNRFGWRSYLGAEPGGESVSPLAAPGRCQDLRDLPPAWVGVGSHDLFHDECLRYARGLLDAGVPCDLSVVPGAYHAFDVVERRAGVSRSFVEQQVNALRGAVAAG